MSGKVVVTILVLVALCTPSIVRAGPTSLAPVERTDVISSGEPLQAKYPDTPEGDELLPGEGYSTYLDAEVIDPNVVGDREDAYVTTRPPSNPEVAITTPLVEETTQASLYEEVTQSPGTEQAPTSGPPVQLGEEEVSLDTPEDRNSSFSAGGFSDLDARLQSVQKRLTSRLETVRTGLLPALTFNTLRHRLDGARQNLTARDCGVHKTLTTRLEHIQSSFTQRLHEIRSHLSQQLLYRKTNISARLEDIEYNLTACMEETELTFRRRSEQMEAELTEGLHELRAGLLGQRQETETSLAEQLDAVVLNLEARRQQLQANLSSQLERIQLHLADQLQQAVSGTQQVADCSQLPPGAAAGHYRLSNLNASAPEVFCETGGWTVIQRRADVLPHQDFFLGWQQYKDGFGSLDGEFWWGNEKLHQLTSRGVRYQLRIDMEDFEEEKRYALYRDFSVGPESDGYRLKVSGYSGDAADSLTYHSDRKFSTKDRDQDEHGTNCAADYKGGWWYRSCHYANLNGLYLNGPHSSYANGINWHHWKGYNYSLKFVEMKIRPVAEP